MRDTTSLHVLALGMGLLHATGCSSGAPEVGAPGGGSASGSEAPAATGGEESDGGASPSASGMDAAPADVASQSTARGCVYPPGPYGLTEGSTLPPTLSWQGFVDGSTQPTTVAIADYLDCDGSRGINALEVDVGSAYCTQCRAEAPVLEQFLDGAGGEEGVNALTLLIKDESFAPATVETAGAWARSFGLTKTAVAADPAITFPIDDIPTSIIVDPRTMTVVLFLIGYDPSALTALANHNAK
jgi:hypothetical protein